MRFADDSTGLSLGRARNVKSIRKKAAATRRSIVIVHAFTRPADALGELAKVAPGVVITDYSMPQMNGAEFISRASKIEPKAVFIMISGNDLEAIELELNRLKRLKLRLQKPFGWRPLVDAVLKVWPGPDMPALVS